MKVMVFHRVGAEFQQVCDVEVAAEMLSVDALEVAFASTNHIHDDWSNNDNVSNVVGTPRSSMVGDIFVIPSRGESWACKMSGWANVSRDQV